MVQTISPNDSRLSWPGAVSLQRENGAIMPWRIPEGERGLYALPLVERAAMPAGVRLTFRSDTAALCLRAAPYPERSPVDLFCNGELLETVETADRDEIRFGGLPAGENVLELWLPQFGEFRLYALEIDDGASLAAVEDARPRWITYGSSITHCRQAASPSETWPAIVARRQGYNLTCLGFGGQCHLDPMIARLMRDLPADFLSMCVGINIYGGATLNPRTFGPGILGFVRIVREKHPDTPFAILSPIFSPPRETVTNVVGFTLEAMRGEVESAVATLQAHGDRHLHYIDGREIFSADAAHLLPDDLHPNAEGYRLMGENFVNRVAKRLFSQD